MTEAGAGGLLDSEEVEFLLQADNTAENAGDNLSALDQDQEQDAVDDREVTMRGDLDQIELADIFQTLSISKMEGMLRVRNPLEQRELVFKEGYVQCIVPNRVETRRLGQRLIQAGMLTANQLRSCLLLQKKSRKAIGLILVEEGHVSETDIENILVDQVQEELFGLFTWKQGTFEFYKGPLSSPELLRKVDMTPEFEVGGVLLEVARRSDEWQMIMEALHSLEEIYQPRTDVDAPDLTDEETAVLTVANGHHSVRDLADATLLPLFECARALSNLLRKELVAPISVATGLENAEERIAQGDVKRAVVIVSALANRKGGLTSENVVAMSGILNRSGESKAAGQILLDHAKRLESTGEAISLARQASKLNIRSREVLEFLYSLLIQLDSPDQDELNDVATDLLDCMVADNQAEDALDLLTTLEERGFDSANNRAKKARILTKLDRKEEAIAELLTLAEVYKSEKCLEKLAAIYEQVLKIDYRRKDIAKALKALHAGKLVQRAKIGLVVGAVGIVGMILLSQYKAWVLDSDIALVATEIRTIIDAGDLVQAGTRIRAARTELGLHATLDVLDKLVAAKIADKRRIADSELGRRRGEMSGAAKELLDKGNLLKAIDTYYKLAEVGESLEKIEEIIRGRILALYPELEVWARELPRKLPVRPTNMQRRAELEAVLAKIDSDFTPRSRKLAAAVLECADDERFKAILGPIQTEKITAVAQIVHELTKTAMTIREEYVHRINRNDKARGLTVVFAKAKKAENAFEFSAALKHYRTLQHGHPTHDELARHFKRKIEDLSTIIRFMQVIEKATKKGDFNTAQGQLYSLKQAYPDIPFDELAYLPVWIETSPPNAKVTLNGKPTQGRTPVLARFLPSEKTRIVVELDGFFPEQTTLQADRLLGRITSLLSKKPDWVSKTSATVDRSPVVDDTNRGFVTDRAGNVSAFGFKDGLELWRVETKDLSGFLSRPALFGAKHLVVGSVDGNLRCFVRETGKVSWTVPGLPSESQPLITGSTILIATHDKRLVQVDKHGKVLDNSLPLDSKVQADLITVGGKAVVATSEGQVLLVDPRTLAILHKTTDTGRGIICTPAHDSQTIVVVTDEGKITALDARTLNTQWQVQLQGELTLSPALSMGRVFVADDRNLRIFDQKTGAAIGEPISCDSHWSSHLSIAHGKLYAGEQQGVIHAFDPATLAPVFLIRNHKPAIAPVLELGKNAILIPFGDRTLKAFYKLP